MLQRNQKLIDQFNRDKHRWPRLQWRKVKRRVRFPKLGALSHAILDLRDEMRERRRLHEPQMAWRKTMSEDLSTTFNEASYAQLLNQVKSRIREARVRAGLAANRELVALYWEVGKL